MLIKSWDVLMVDQIFLWPQVKQSMIIIDKMVYRTYQTSLKTTYKISGKLLSKLSLPPEIKFFSVLTKVPWKTKIKFFSQCAISHEN